MVLLDSDRRNDAVRSMRAGGERSPFLSLIQKEWQRQRRIWFWLTFLLIVVIVLAIFLFPRVPESAQDSVSMITGVLLLLLGGGLIVLLGAKSFAFRRDEPAGPLSRNTVFWCKLATNFALCLPALMVFCAGLAWWAAPEALAID